MLSGYDEEIEKFLDDEAENYVSMEEKLLQRGIDFETAVTAADKFCGKFDNLLSVKGIEKNNISQVCTDIAELLKHDTGMEAEFLYTEMLSEVLLLFGEIEDNEQKVELWLEQSEKMYYFIHYFGGKNTIIKRFPIYQHTSKRVHSVKRILRSTKFFMIP